MEEVNRKKLAVKRLVVMACLGEGDSGLPGCAGAAAGA